MEPETFETIENPLVQDALKESIRRGEAFTLLMSSESWNYIKTFIENSIQTFANRAIRDGFKDYNEYQLERGKVLGLSNLLSEIENDLRIANEQHQKPTEPTIE
jgi:hypothetical protein